jgi:hypothetical protein
MHLTARPQQQQQQQEAPQQDGAGTAGAEGLRDTWRAVSNTSMQVGGAGSLALLLLPPC